MLVSLSTYVNTTSGLLGTLMNRLLDAVMISKVTILEISKLKTALF